MVLSSFYFSLRGWCLEHKFFSFKNSLNLLQNLALILHNNITITNFNLISNPHKFLVDKHIKSFIVDKPVFHLVRRDTVNVFLDMRFKSLRVKEVFNNSFFFNFWFLHLFQTFLDKEITSKLEDKGHEIFTLFFWRECSSNKVVLFLQLSVKIFYSFGFIGFSVCSLNRVWHIDITFWAFQLFFFKSYQVFIKIASAKIISFWLNIRKLLLLLKIFGLIWSWLSLVVHVVHI